MADYMDSYLFLLQSYSITWNKNLTGNFVDTVLMALLHESISLQVFREEQRFLSFISNSLFFYLVIKAASGIGDG